MIYDEHSVPVQAIWSEDSLKPALQLAHFLAPFLVHAAPVDAMPLEHEHTLAVQLDPSPLTLQPVSQLATKHPDP